MEKEKMNPPIEGAAYVIFAAEWMRITEFLKRFRNLDRIILVPKTEEGKEE